MMLSALKRFWGSLAGGSTGSDQPPKTLRAKKVEFRLLHGTLPIGSLTYEDGLWTFAYSDEFKKRLDLRPIVQFPDREKVYRSDELWPFFGMRIPSLKQPAVEKLVAEEHIDPSDRAELLKRFGRRTISNPYELAECS